MVYVVNNYCRLMSCFIRYPETSLSMCQRGDRGGGGSELPSKEGLGW